MLMLVKLYVTHKVKKSSILTNMLVRIGKESITPTTEGTSETPVSYSVSEKSKMTVLLTEFELLLTIRCSGRGI